MERYHNTAIVFGSLKDALLHFDYVIPMNFTGQFMGVRPVAGEQRASIERFNDPEMDDYNELCEVFGQPDALLNLYPPHLAKDPIFKGAANLFDGLLFSYMVRAAYGDDAFKSYIGNLSQDVKANKPIDSEQYCPTAEDLQRLFNKLVTDFQLNGIPVDCSQFIMGNVHDTPPTNCLFVPEIRVIDTEKTTFSQIMKLRDDKEMMYKMRNFRLFAYQQYAGKDRAFIEDDIQKRLADYSDAVKACGFETKVKTLSFLLESKLLIGALATSAVSVLLGNVQLAIEAFSAGAVIELGKLSLEYAKQRHTLAKICHENPVSYFADVRQRLEGQHE